MFKLLQYFTCSIIFLFLMKPAVTHAESLKKIDYTIISDSDFRNEKRSVDVRLKNKVTLDTLGEIARNIKTLQEESYNKTFIFYYLPNMEVGAGAWATSHFRPELDVKIMGLSLEQEGKITQEITSASRDVIGVWRDNRPYVSADVTIYREKSKLYMETRYHDGSFSNEEMTEEKFGIGTKLIQKGGNPHGEYFLIDKQNNLKAGGNNGIFLVYKKVQ